MSRVQFLKILGPLLLALILFVTPKTQGQSLQCGPVHTQRQEIIKKSIRKWTIQRKQVALDMMVEGSLNVSRTKVVGRRYIAPADVADNQIAVLAERNFIKAARYVLENLSVLEVDRNTAIRINSILTEGLVPENIRGQPNYRRWGTYSHLAEGFDQKDPDSFYLWISSLEARKLMKVNPVLFAEKMHHTIVAYDSFPDGNGRLSRLFADFVLMKNGFAPAFYTDMADYFDRGNARADVSREEMIKYFIEIVKRGQEEMRRRVSLPKAFHFENHLSMPRFKAFEFFNGPFSEAAA